MWFDVCFRIMVYQQNILKNKLPKLMDPTTKSRAKMDVIINSKSEIVR